MKHTYIRIAENSEEIKIQVEVSSLKDKSVDDICIELSDVIDTQKYSIDIVNTNEFYPTFFSPDFEQLKEIVFTNIAN